MIPTVVVLGPSAEEQAARYAAVLEGIGHDPSRFGELATDDAEFCIVFLHAKLIWLTQQMHAKADDAECEAAIARALYAGSETLDRQVTLATKRMQAGLPQTLRDLAAMWVSQCAIKSQIEFALERRTSAMN